MIGIVLGILLFTFNFIDALFTSYFIGLYGVDMEINPIVKVMVDFMGMWWVAPKILMGGFAAFVVMASWDKVPRAKKYIVPTVIIYGFLSIYHLICYGVIII